MRFSWPLLLRNSRRLNVNFLIIVTLCLIAVITFYFYTRPSSDPHFPNPMIDNCGYDPTDLSQPHARDARCVIREMARVAWSNYYHTCAGSEGNELRAINRSCNTDVDSIAGQDHLLTAVESLDTLHLMELKAEYLQAYALVRDQFHLKIGVEASVFEVTIRFLGGFLGAFSLTKDPMFIDRARQVGEAIYGAFSGRVPQPRIKLYYQAPPANKTNLAEAGSLYLELMYLSELTQDEKFAKVARKVQDFLLKIPSEQGVYPLDITVSRNELVLQKSAASVFSIGARGDSFYEYLVKRCIFDQPVSSKCKDDYSKSLDGIMKLLAVDLGVHGVCITEMGRKECVMEHLTCFAGGMFALAYLQNRSRTDWLTFALRVTEACYWSYQDSKTGLGPEIFAFNQVTKRMEAKVDFYILRPEFVESLFILHRVTGEQQYRYWGWQVVSALVNQTFTGKGFSGILNMQSHPKFDDVQQSFFLAETLKYLYLLFSDSNKLKLSDWLFNTEAHPIPTNTNRNFARGRWTRD